MPRFHQLPPRAICIRGITDLAPAKRAPRFSLKREDMAPAEVPVQPVKSSASKIKSVVNDVPEHLTVPDAFFDNGMHANLLPWDSPASSDAGEDEVELPEHLIHLQAPGFHHHHQDGEQCYEAPQHLFSHEADSASYVDDVSSLFSHDHDHH